MSQHESKDKSENPDQPRQSIANRLKNILMTEITPPHLGMQDLIANMIHRQKDTNIRTENAEYTRLRDLLAQGNWKEADQETWKIICFVVGRAQEGWLESDSLVNFPCEDLLLLDQLWVEFSQGHFGFSVQKRIYQSLGGKNIFDDKIWQSMGDRVGWRSHGHWLNYLELKFDKHALEGHLPVEPIKVTMGANPTTYTKRGMVSFSVFSRLEICQKQSVK